MKSLKYTKRLLLAFVVGLLVFKITNPSSTELATSPAAVEKNINAADNLNNRMIASIAKENKVIQPVTPISQTLITKKILTEAQTSLLKQFDVMKSKVFLTLQEKKLKKMVLSDQQLIKNLQTLLLQPALIMTGSEEYVQRNVAVDLLIESSTEEKSVEATEVVLAIIQDTQIEDNTISEQERQSMAEVKAELLYTWTAKMPSQIEKVNTLIPGPVTAKIWANAQAFQVQNRLESDTFD